MMQTIFHPAVAVGIAVLVMAVAAVWESLTTRVPNALTVTAIVNAVIYVLLKSNFLDSPGGGLPAVLAGMVVGGVTLLPLYQRLGLGAGCVKAFAAYGAWLGCGLGLLQTVVWVLASLVAGIIVLGLYTIVGKVRQRQEVSGQTPLTLGALTATVLIVWCG